MLTKEDLEKFLTETPSSLMQIAIKFPPRFIRDWAEPKPKLRIVK